MLDGLNFVPAENEHLFLFALQQHYSVSGAIFGIVQLKTCNHGAFFRCHCFGLLYADGDCFSCLVFIGWPRLAHATK